MLAMLRNHFGFAHQSYAILKKSDVRREDDRDPLQLLKEMCRVGPRTVRNWTNEGISDFSKSLVVTTQQIPLTTSNYSEIKQVICKVAGLNRRFQKFIAQELAGSTMDQHFCSRLIISVNMRCPTWS